MLGTGKRSPPALLDTTVERIRAQGGKDYGIEQRAKALEWVSKALNSAGVLRSPFDWSSGPHSFHGQSRNPEIRRRPELHAG